jgi:hypothetical protein
LYKNNGNKQTAAHLHPTLAPVMPTNTMTTQNNTAKAATIPNFRINADQLVDFGFGTYGECVVKYLGKCPVTGVRMYDLPGASYIEHQATTLVAAEYDMTGPDFVYSWMASNDQTQYKRALAMAKSTWMPGPAQVGPTQTIHISGRRWFDKTYGNTYFSAVGQVNGVVVARIDFRYGYSNQYEHEMTALLASLGFLPGLLDFGKGRPQEAVWSYAERVGAEYTTSVSDVSRRRDL